MKKVLQRLLSPIRVTWLQSLYESLYLFSLYAMNYGGSSFTDDSGEKAALRYIKRKVKPSLQKFIVFDVGANIGNYARMAATELGLNAQIHCFEPSIPTYKQLLGNIGQLNALAYNIGLSSEPCEMPLYTDAETSGMTSVYNRDLAHTAILFNQQEVAHFDTIDLFCERNMIDHIALLKIDVEGHELGVLKGASTMITAGKIQFIQFEFGGTHIDSRTYFKDFWNLLTPANYIFYRIVGNGLRRVDTYSELLEIFMTVNFIAELAPKY